MLSRFATLAVATLLALAAAEGAIRLSGLGIGDFVHDSRKLAETFVLADGGYLTMPAGAVAEVGGHEVRANSLGARDREPPPPDTAATRVLFLGDSTTFGWGVAYEESFPVLVRESLAGGDVAVDVAALPGWNSRAERAFLEAHVGRYDPDVVVVLYDQNDREPVSPYLLERARATSTWGRLRRFAIAHSKLVEWAAFARETYLPRDYDRYLRITAERERQRTSAGAPFAADDPWWMQSASELERMRQILEREGRRLVVFVFRNRERLGRVDVALERLQEFGAATSVPVYDTWPMLAGVPVRERILSAYDQHPNALGHRLLADGILARLRSSGVLSLASAPDG